MVPASTMAQAMGWEQACLRVHPLAIQDYCPARLCGSARGLCAALAASPTPVRGPPARDRLARAARPAMALSPVQRWIRGYNVGRGPGDWRSGPAEATTQPPPPARQPRPPLSLSGIFCLPSGRLYPATPGRRPNGADYSPIWANLSLTITEATPIIAPMYQHKVAQP